MTQPVVSQKLLDYIREHLAKGANFEELKQFLVSHGWKSGDVDEALRLSVTGGKVVAPAGSGESMPKRTHVTVAQVLYYIGGAIVFLGIVILVAQNWYSLPNASKVLVTLGSGIAMYFSGIFFNRSERLKGIGVAFFFISALLLPFGISITFNVAGFRVNTFETQSIISAILFVTYLASYFVFRNRLFAAFAIMFATWFYYSFTDSLVSKYPIFHFGKFFGYQTLVAGLSYLFLGYSFARRLWIGFPSWLYSFGIVGFLGAALGLGGWQPRQQVFWELIFPGLVFGTILLSVYLKRRSFLVFGSLFLMLYILKITTEYFQRGFGWPLSLVVAGFSLIAIGYLAFYLDRRYLKTRN